MDGMSNRFLHATVENRGQHLLETALARATTGEMSVGDLISSATGLAASSRGLEVALYKTWIAFHPDNASLYAVYFNYAVSMADSGDVSGAVNALREAIRLKPEFGPPHINLGTLLERLGQAGAAVETWLSFVNTLSPITPEAIRHKVLALKQTGRVLESANRDAAAEDALLQCLELDPAQDDAIQHWIALRQRQCKWPAVVGTERLSAASLRAAMSPLSAAYFADDPVFQLATAANYARRAIGIAPKGSTPGSAAVTRDRSQRRLRIGYLSSDLREHAVGFGMTEVMELHDRTKVETFAYYCGIQTSDATQQRTIRAVEHWTDLNGLTDTEAADIIRGDGIDILVDLNGYTKDARTKVFAMRPAPVAVNWFGFPGSMGTSYHHYLIADQQVIPPENEMYYTEKIVRLPCYQPNDRKRRVAAETPSRAEAGLPEAAFVFCCLNGMQKLTSACFGDWMTILTRTPRSVLWLLGGAPETNERLKAEAESQGVAASRLVFAEKRRNPDHLARMPLADLFLDTFPYGAHTTASDALWMGLPVLTLRGRGFASRVCASLVTAAGVPELVCASAEQYVARATELARDGHQLAALRERLGTGRDTCALFDTPGLVRSLETLYLEMHRSMLDGTLPRPDLSNLEIYHDVGAHEDLETPGLHDTRIYLQRYRRRLAELDGTFPIRPDNRLWPEGAAIM